MADAHKNFILTTVATAPSPATTGTSLVVAAGDGATLPTPPFNMVVWPVAVPPAADNAEIVRVTNVATDTLTIVREQESTTAREIVSGDQIGLNITAKLLTDIEDAVALKFASADVIDEDDMASNSATKVPTQQSVKAYVDNAPHVTGLLADAYINGILYFSHRGGTQTNPENTMEAFRATVAAGAKAIETDCYLLKDGALGIMHDTTLTRTTTSGLTTDQQISSSWGALVVDIGATLGGVWTSKTQVPPLADEVIKEFGNKVLLCLEAKNTGSGAAIVALLQKYHVPTDAAMVTSFTIGELAAAVTAGYPAILATSDSTTDAATIAAAGVSYVSVVSTTAEAYVDALLAESLGVFVYTIDSHYIRDTFIGYGATGFFSNDPIYMQETSIMTSDPFGAQTWPHGLTLAAGDNRGAFFSPDLWGFSTSAADGARWQVRQGWACPIGGDPANDTFTIDFDVNFASIPSARWCSIFVCAGTDRPFVDAADDAGVNGYHCLFRVTGIMDIYEVLNGVGTLIATTTTGTAITAGNTYSLRLTVTPTTVKWERLGASAISVTATDSTYRGGYFQFGARSLASPKFSNVVIT